MSEIHTSTLGGEENGYRDREAVDDNEGFRSEIGDGGNGDECDCCYNCFDGCCDCCDDDRESDQDGNSNCSVVMSRLAIVWLPIGQLLVWLIVNSRSGLNNSRFEFRAKPVD